MIVPKSAAGAVKEAMAKALSPQDSADVAAATDGTRTIASGRSLGKTDQRNAWSMPVIPSAALRLALGVWGANLNI
jgi:hypothetical protein